MFDKPVKMRYNRLKKREREVNSMKYTVKMKNRGRDWGTPIETDDLREALRIERQNNVRYVGIITIIIERNNLLFFIILLHISIILKYILC